MLPDGSVDLTSTSVRRSNGHVPGRLSAQASSCPGVEFYVFPGVSTQSHAIQKATCGAASEDDQSFHFQVSPDIPQILSPGTHRHTEEMLPNPLSQTESPPAANPKCRTATQNPQTPNPPHTTSTLNPQRLKLLEPAKAWGCSLEKDPLEDGGRWSNGGRNLMRTTCKSASKIFKNAI